MKEVKNLQLRGKSILSPMMAEFVAQKRAMGFKFNAAVESLNLFDRFCVDEDVKEPILTAALIEKWSDRKRGESIPTHVCRVTCVRGFLRFMHNNGFTAPTTFHPLTMRGSNFVPYIFTEDETRKLLMAVDENSPACSVSPFRHLVMPVLFRMLCCCGLRVSEALQLKVNDVDLSKGVLIIANAKGGKERLVAMSGSLTAICRAYRDEMLSRGCEHEYFFPAPDGGLYDGSTIYDNFRKYLHAAGIPHRGRGKGPRLHDLRHTFAVNVLNRWVLEGKDLYTCLPILSTYLGHVSLTSTEEYLRLVPEAYGDLTSSFEHKFETMFPEVADEN